MVWDSVFCGTGINILPAIVEMKDPMKDLKGLLGEFRGWSTAELSSMRLAGLSVEDRERHLLEFCRLAFGHHEELPIGYQGLVDGYLDGERGENSMMWYLTRHMPWKNACYESYRLDLFLRMAKLVEFTDRDGRLLYSRSAACLCVASFIRSLLDPNSEVLPESLAGRLSVLNILPDDILGLAGKGEIMGEM